MDTYELRRKPVIFEKSKILSSSIAERKFVGHCQKHDVFRVYADIKGETTAQVCTSNFDLWLFPQLIVVVKLG